MATLCAVLIPVLVGFGTVAIDQGYYGYRNLLLKQNDTRTQRWQRPRNCIRITQPERTRPS